MSSTKSQLIETSVLTEQLENTTGCPKKNRLQENILKLLLMASKCVSYMLKGISWVPILQDLRQVIPEGIPSIQNLLGPLKCSCESEVVTIVKYPKADFILGHPVHFIEFFNKHHPPTYQYHEMLSHLKSVRLRIFMFVECTELEKKFQKGNWVTGHLASSTYMPSHYYIQPRDLYKSKSDTIVNKTG